ncbi:MAG TPA: class I SAM-dependent methyltransferase [Acidimicrobiales bacterium]|nr:class I SAM-dependent methyltransferase [Acidimicrobiales bacterium]
MGEICRIGPDSRILDLASGTGEMLCQYAARYGSSGIGVDIFPPLVAEAKERAEELGVRNRVDFIEGDAGQALDLPTFNFVSCIGATWIGGDLAGTIEIMKLHVEPGGWIVVGECYWKRPPSAELAVYYGQPFADLAGTLDIFEQAEIDLVEMVLTNEDDWDRYAASQWLNVADWLLANPDHPDAAAVRAERDESRRSYLTEGRETLGWGVFIGRAP